MDVKSGTIDRHLSIRITRFLMKCVGMWYPDNYRDKVISNVVVLYTLFTLIIATWTLNVDAYYSIHDLHAIVYNIPCTVDVNMELFKLIVFLLSRSEVLDLNSYTDSTFWKIKYNREDLKILDRDNVNAMKSVLIYCLVSLLVILQYLALPIFENMGQNVIDRRHPFKIWLEFPFPRPTETPYYEILYILQSTAAVGTALCAGIFRSFLFTLNVNAACQFKLLQRELTFACTAKNSGNIDLDVVNDMNMSFTKLRSCIKKHQILIHYMERIENLYCIIMLAEALTAVLKISALGFQVILGMNGSIWRLALSVQFLIGAVMGLYLFSWSCHQIIIESLEVALAAYNAAWYSLDCSEQGKSYRQSLLIVVERARRPCILTLGKFAPMSLETFATVVRRAISFFTILQQFDIDLA